MAALPFAGTFMNLSELNKLALSFNPSKKMPVLFVGHGSPMNAIDDNEFALGWREVGKQLPKPSAILCISAHWETRGTWVTGMQNPRTIHDFGGFPEALYQVQYPAEGSPEIASETRKTIKSTEVGVDSNWGLDHGCWSILGRMYPEADVPVIQLSLDKTRQAQYHYNLAQELAVLREKGVLIIGSGNMVHNLRMVAWNRLNDPGFAFDWALEASEKMKQLILAGDHLPLINYPSQGSAFNLAIPTPEHFLPLLYALALQENGEKVEFFNDSPVGGSLTMTSLKISV